MDDELEEIAEELRNAGNLLRRLMAKSSDDGSPEEKKVWLVYLSVEKSVALLKLRLSIESPGRFVKVHSEPGGWVSQLTTASESLGEALRLLKVDRLEDALNKLRTSRNGLRAFLGDSRRVRLKALRNVSRGKV